MIHDFQSKDTVSFLEDVWTSDEPCCLQVLYDVKQEKFAYEELY